MENTYWHKQSSKPLYPSVEWNKPERRDQAGKLFIIGGDIHHLTAPAKAFEITRHSGIGAIKIALPDKTKPIVSRTLPNAVFLPSTKSGELSKDGEQALIDELAWADAVLFPGDNGRNSETTILFESILRAYKEQVVLTKDAVDVLSNSPTQLINRERTLLVLSFAQLQKLVKQLHMTTPIVHSIDLIKLVDFLHVFTQQINASIVTLHQRQLVVAVNGIISTTRFNFMDKLAWRLDCASLAACYITWNPHKTFEALTQTCWEVAQNLSSTDNGS